MTVARGPGRRDVSVGLPRSSYGADRGLPPVLRADPLLPFRDHLLHDEAATDLMARCLGRRGRLDVRRIDLLRVKYRIGESVRSVHRVWAEGERWLVSCRMRSTGADSMYADALAGEVPCPPVRGVAFDAEAGAVFWTFPNDRCLTGLDALTPTSPILADTYPGALTVDIAGYNPERAAIARVTGSDGLARGYVKLYGDDSMDAARRTLEWLQRSIAKSGSALRVPRLRACDEHHRLLIVDRVDGEHLVAVPEAERAWAFEHLGVALARLHALPVDHCSLPPFGAFAAPELTRASDVVAWARPDLADLARRTAGMLSEHPPAIDESVCVHGDLNARNWLVRRDQPAFAKDTAGRRTTNDHVGLIDLDMASRGPAAVDIAGVLAWIRARALTGEWSSRCAEELSEAFTHGYGSVRQLPTDTDLHWCLAAALLVERAQRAITRVRRDQLACLDTLLASAHAEALEARRARL